MNEPPRLARTSDRFLLALLLSATVVPTAAGLYRLLMLAGLVAPNESAARLFVAGPVLAVHIVDACAFVILGAFQVAPRFRARHPRAHRVAGTIAAAAGVGSALSGLWLTTTVAPGVHDGRALFWMRLVVGTSIVAYVALGLFALRRGRYAAHGAWMLRAYALGLGAGTQVVTHLALRVVGIDETTESRTLAMGAGWLVNALVAESLLRSRETVRKRARGERGGAVVRGGLGVAVALATLGASRAALADDVVPSDEPPPRRSAPVPAPVDAPVSTSSTPASPPRPESPGSALVGARVRYIRSDTVAATAEAASVQLVARFEAHDDEASIVAYRGRLDFGLGGGTAKVDGLLAGAMLAGLRLPLAIHHAPFLRLGFGGEIEANARMLASRFDLPLGELGYHYVNDATLFEAGFRASPVLAGRFRANADVRLLSASFSYGAFVAMQSAHTKVDLLFTRIEARDGLGGPIDTWRGTACLLPGTWLAVCAEGQLVNADFGGQRMASGSVGGMLGVGDVTGSRRRGR